jgi:hypothetical protein
MPMDQRDQRRSGGQRGAAPGKVRPWNVFRIKETADADGVVHSDFQPCGVAWPLKEGEGFNVDVHFALPEGSRLLIKPRKDSNGGGR